MSNINYTVFKEIHFEHEYYEDKRSEDFVLVPTQESKMLLESNDLLFKQSNGAVSILSKVGNTIDKDIKLTFLVHCENYNLLKISNLNNIKRFYLGIDCGQLSIQNNISLSNELFDVKSQYYWYYFKKESTKKIEIDEQWIEENIENNERNLKSGIYDWKETNVDSTISTKRVYFDNEIAEAKPFFTIIDFFIPIGITTTKQSFTIKIDTLTQPWLYFLINYKNKNTKTNSIRAIVKPWLQFLIGNKEKKVEVAEINVNNATIDFENSAFQKVTDDADLNTKIKEIKDRDPDRIEDVYVFKSDNPLKIKEKDLRKVVFKESDKVLIEDLPKPTIDNFNSMKISNTIYSTIFFNI